MYDPFKWADNYTSEEEYFQELEEEENDKKRSNADSGRVEEKEY